MGAQPPDVTYDFKYLHLPELPYSAAFCINYLREQSYRKNYYLLSNVADHR